MSAERPKLVPTARRSGPPALPEQQQIKHSQTLKRRLFLWTLFLSIPTYIVIHVLFISAGYTEVPWVTAWKKFRGKYLTSSAPRAQNNGPKADASQSESDASPLPANWRREPLTPNALLNSYKPDKLGRVNSRYTGEEVAITGQVKITRGPIDGAFFILMKGPADEPKSRASPLMGGRISCRGFLNDLRVGRLREGQRVTVEGTCIGVLNSDRTINPIEIGNVGLGDCRLTKVWTQEDMLAEVVTKAMPVTIKQLRQEVNNELGFKKKYEHQYVKVEGRLEGGSLYDPAGVKLSYRFRGRDPIGTRADGLQVKLVGLPRKGYYREPVVLESALLATPKVVLDRMILKKEAIAEASKQARLLVLENELYTKPFEVFQGQLVFGDKSKSEINSKFRVQFTGSVVRVTENRDADRKEYPYYCVLVDKQKGIEAKCCFLSKHRAKLEGLESGRRVTVVGFAEVERYSTGKYLRLENCIIR